MKKLDLSLIAVMSVAGILLMLFPVQKAAVSAAIDLPSLVPAEIPGWTSVTYDTADYQDQWQSINFLLARTYTHTEKKHFLDFILEYSSDVRRAFSFHFPEDCYRAGGSDISFLKTFEMQLPNGQTLKAKTVLVRDTTTTQGKGKIFRLIVYWLVLGGKQVYTTLNVKLDQMLGGLISKVKDGVLVRVEARQAVEYNQEGLMVTEERMRQYILELYAQLSEEQKRSLFGSR